MSVILPGIIVFGIVVFIHELGHFLVAKACGVTVDRFSIGFGPKLVGFRRGPTEYVVSALPLGGYVKMAGDELPEAGEAPRPDTFLGHPWWHRVLIALAGPGANFIFAIAVATIIFLTGYHFPDTSNIVGDVHPGSPMERVGLQPKDVIVGVDGRSTAGGTEVRLALLGGEQAPRLEEPVDVPLVVDRGGRRVPLSVPASLLKAVTDSLVFFIPPVIGEVWGGKPAYFAGLKEGDRILSVDGAPVDAWGDLTATISRRPGEEVNLVVQRGDRQFELKVKPDREEEDGRVVGRIGILAERLEYIKAYPPGRALALGTTQTLDQVAGTALGILSLFKRPGEVGKSVSGPIGIIEMSGRASQKGFFYLANFTALISVALMVFNLLPIPILDGGMVTMAVVEGIRRRPVPIRVQAAFQKVGLVLLGSLILFAILNDPLKMIRRSRAISNADGRSVATGEPGQKAPDASER